MFEVPESTWRDELGTYAWLMDKIVVLGPYCSCYQTSPTWPNPSFAQNFGSPRFYLVEDRNQWNAPEKGKFTIPVAYSSNGG